jgi:hypothetical protein
MRFKVSPIFIVIALITMFTASCKKERALTTGGILKFSDDTLKFDTVFTAAGSYTNITKIYNPQNQEIVISSVQLRNGPSSFFHLNVDGRQGNIITNLKIAAHDSLYVFATVNINPTDSLNPFFITDELVATLNGKQFSIPFTAYGQNAHYIVSDSIGTNTTWLTDLPYVVIHSLVVGPTSVLTIPAKCRVYMHQDARIFVFGGLLVNPSKTDSVVFQGDRLDRYYFSYMGYPGEWGGIYFTALSQGIINNAVLKNCGGSTSYRGIPVPGSAIRVDSAATVLIDHTTVKNSIGDGLISYQGNVTATNSLFCTAGGYAMALLLGGNDSITNCTFANYGGNALSHATPGTVAILNYYSPDGRTYYYGDLNAVMRNCVVYGSMDSEMICDAAPQAAANLRLDHCLLKPGIIIPDFVHMTNCIISQTPEFKNDPLFKNNNSGDFHLKAGSPAINAGVSVPNIGSKDLDGNSRVDGSGIDLGCYEFKP